MIAAETGGAPMTFSYEWRYRGRSQAPIRDRSGTTMDYGGLDDIETRLARGDRP